MDNLSSFDTTQIPIRPVINGGDDFRKNAWRWISQMLQEHVKSLWGVVTSSKQVVVAVEQLRVDANDLLVAIDVKEFCLNITDNLMVIILVKALRSMGIHPLLVRLAEKS